ncbi:hypothetical protein CWE08_02810 [Aliidiomarina iranensis]|uniref:HPt domain-containing protein n=1 Tax=Aliidiomarina iranensis TaxID=1434071 RepID=A0A432W349_9GAMM|nr:Hpt domain-containing protein [Aliidiomarina iranensis]RUO23593.1 hypothetical protein CWE08_02810 [Aliidiomarina iranensis]
MTTRNSNEIDWALLQQYQQILGIQGIADSFTMFLQVLPDYQAELERLVATRDEAAVRSHAHKIKGSCRSLGFQRLGEEMQFIEKEPWQWGQVESLIAEWPHHYSADTTMVENWLAGLRKDS